MTAADRVEGLGARSDEDGSREFLRLERGAGGELRARKPRREAEVVLDARRGAGLPADGDRFDHDRRQALRAAVNGCGKARGACADYQQIAGLYAIRRVEWNAEGRRHLCEGRG